MCVLCTQSLSSKDLLTCAYNGRFHTNVIWLVHMTFSFFLIHSYWHQLMSFVFVLTSINVFALQLMILQSSLISIFYRMVLKCGERGWKRGNGGKFGNVKIYFDSFQLKKCGGLGGLKTEEYPLIYMRRPFVLIK